LEGERVGCYLVPEAARISCERPNAWILTKKTVSPLDQILFRASIQFPDSEGKGKKLVMSMKLYVGNLSFQTSSYELEELFGGVGTVESATVVEDRETGRSRGFGFVEMSSQEEGERAIAEFNGKEFAGRELKVNEAKPREDRGGRGGYGGGGGGHRGGGGGYGGQRESRW
jgi:cold-inducible RNA-binding protein